MSDDEGKKTSLRARLSETLRAVVGDNDASVLDTAVQSIGESIRRWNSAGAVRRFMGGLGGDLLTAPGECVELSVTLGAVTRLGGEHVRFFVGGQAIGDSQIEGEHAFLNHEPETSGLHAIEVEVLSKSGHVVAGREAMESRWLHVTERPLAVVEADLFLLDPEQRAPDLSPIRGLPDAGFDVAYYDLNRDDRQHEIRDAIAQFGLPRGAVLVHPGLENELDTWGADFTTVFSRTTVRRLRASGVPIVLVVSAAEFDTDAVAEEGLIELSLKELSDELSEPKRLQPAQRRAHDFLELRKKTDPLRWRLDQSTKSTAVQGNSFRFELDNAAARKRLFEIIDGAQRSIALQLYIFKESRFSDDLVVRLIRRAREGVSVRMLIDALYSGENVLGMTNRLIRALEREDNIAVFATSPIVNADQVDSTRLKQRDHRKLLIVDGQRAVVSGRNASDEYYTGFDEVPVHDQTLHEHIPWLDAHVEVEGPLVMDIAASFETTWAAQTDVEPAELDEVAPAGEASGRLVLHAGLEDANGMAQYEAMLDAANEHVYIVNDFPIVASLGAAVRRAVGRGVRVRLLTGNAVARRADGTFFQGPLHRELFEYMVKQRLEPLIRRGVEVYELVTPKLDNIVAVGGVVRPYVHAKVMTADGRAASIGSANLDATASYWESEANVVVEDEDFAGRLEAKIDALIAASFRIDLESDYWKRESAQRAITSKLWPAAVYS